MAMPFHWVRGITQLHEMPPGGHVPDVEQVKAARLGGPALTTARAVALAPLQVRAGDALLMAASVTVEAIVGRTVRIPSKVLPADASGFCYFTIDQACLAPGGDRATPNPFDETELPPDLVATAHLVDAVSMARRVAAHIRQPSGHGGVSACSLKTVMAVRSMVQQDARADTVDPAAIMAACCNMLPVADTTNAGEPPCFRGVCPSRVNGAGMDQQR